MYTCHEFKVNKTLFLFLDLSIPHTIGAILVIDTRGKLFGKPPGDRIGLSELNKSALDERGATMFEDFDEDSGSDSSGSSLPGPDEFMRRARVELARRRSPNRPMTGKERFTAGGVSALMAGGASPGSPTEGANQARTKTMDNDDDEFQQAQSSPPRPASPSTSDTALSPRQAMELMTKELAIEDAVTEGVVSTLVDEALADMISPTGKNHPPLSPVKTRLGDPNATSTARLTIPEADLAMHDARVKLSEALHAIAESLSVRHWPDLNVGALETKPKDDAPISPEEHMEREAAGVTGAIVNVWQACDAASAALTAALERKESGGSAMASPRSTTSSIGLNPVPPTSPTRGRNTPPRPRQERAQLEEAVFAAWMESGNNAANLMFSETPLPTSATWPLSPGSGATTTGSGATTTVTSPTTGLPNIDLGGVSSPGKWRAVVAQLAKASLERIAESAFREAAENGGGSSFGGPVSPPGPGSPSSPFGDASPATEPKSRAAVRSESRSAQEWEDLTLIADYMSTTRVLSSALDVWRGWSEESKVARRAAREREMAMAVVEREIARMEFMQLCLRAWKTHCREADRERRARYRLVSRNSIRKLTRTPSSASPKTRSPLDGRKSPSLYDLSTKAREMSAAATAKLGGGAGRVPLDVATAFHRSSVITPTGVVSTPIEKQDSVRFEGRSMGLDRGVGASGRSWQETSPFAATVDAWRVPDDSMPREPTSPPGSAGKFAVPPSLTDAIYGELPSPLERRGRRQY